MADASRAVLITGCSTGIGRATAERLAGSGHTVYATARRLESIADLEEKGCKALSLDVTDEGSMHAAVAAVEEAEGAVGALVNNAGYSQSGAIADDGAYARFNREVAAKTAGAYEGSMSRMAAAPDAVARVIQRAIESRRPRPRYVVTVGARAMLLTRRLLPDRSWDAMMRSQ